MLTQLTLLALSTIAPLAFAGCSGTSSGLTTSSIFGGETAQASQAGGPPPSTPTDRALQVAATSARAQHCGFVFDAATLKSSFLAAEQQAGRSADEMNKIDRQYEYTRTTIASAVSQDPGYCSESAARTIKADLARHRAGDFTPPARSASDGGWLGLGDTSSTARTREVLNPDFILDPTGRTPKTKRVEY